MVVPAHIAVYRVANQVGSYAPQAVELAHCSALYREVRNFGVVPCVGTAATSGWC